jgi:hypothetical protein
MSGICMAMPKQRARARAREREREYSHTPGRRRTVPVAQVGMVIVDDSADFGRFLPG